MSGLDKDRILELLAKHERLEQPDSQLTKEILETLDLEGTCSLGSVLNSHVKEEREAAIKKIRENLDNLLSEDEEVARKAREEVGDFYYCVSDSGIIEP